MKVFRLVVLVVCGFALIFVGCSTRIGEVPAASLEDDTDWISTDSSDSSAPVLTLADIRTVFVSDLSDGEESADCIQYAVCRNFMQTDGDGRFNPEEFVTHGELIDTLWHMSGQEAPEYDGTFSPQTAVTREQLALLLYHFASDSTDPLNTIDTYRDGSLVEEYARAPLAWVLEHGLFDGMVADTIYLALPISRAQLAQVLTAYAAYIEKEPLAQTLAEQLKANQVESASRSEHDEIQKQIDAIAARYGAAGLQAAVVEDGELTDSFSYGWAVKNITPMTADYKIRAASITKVAVGMAAMILNEDGVIDLDESIGAYWGVPIQNPAHLETEVSIRTLLSHSSSLKVFSWEVSRSRDSVRSILQSAGSYMDAAPGSSNAWGYNNYGFGVLGQTLELASGKFLDEILDERIWSVIGIDSAFESGSVRDTDKLATLYENGKVYTSHTALLRNVRPSSLGASGDNYSGGMTISAEELAKMAAILVNDGRYEGLRLLNEESVALMESDSGLSTSDGIPQAYPLRWQDGIYGRDRLYYHTGSGYGVYNLLSYDPAARDAVVVLTTGASGSKDSNGIYAVCGEISQYIYNVIQER